MLVTMTDPSRREHEAVGLLTGLLLMYNSGGNKVPHNLPLLMADVSGAEWKVCGF